MFSLMLKIKMLFFIIAGRREKVVRYIETDMWSYKLLFAADVVVWAHIGETE